MPLRFTIYLYTLHTLFDLFIFLHCEVINVFSYNIENYFIERLVVIYLKEIKNI